MEYQVSTVLNQELWVSFMQLWTIIQPYVIPTLQVLGTILGVVIVAAILALITSLKFLASFWKATIDLIIREIQIFKNFFEGVVKIITSLLKGDFAGAWAGFKQAGGAAIDFVVSKVEYLKSIVSGAINSIKNLSDNARSIIDKIPGRATGGVVNEPVTLVGERGPELVSLPKGSRVHTASQTRQMTSEESGGGVTINLGGVTIGSYMGTEKDKREVAGGLADAIVLELKKRKLI